MDSKATQLNFVSLQVRDLAASQQFYTQVLGFKEAAIKRPDAVVFENQQGAIFAIRRALVDLDESPRLGWGVAPWFGVENIEDFYRQVAEKSYIVRGLQDSPFGKTFVVADPDGYLLTIQQV